MSGRRQFPSLKRTLFQIHQDLDRVVTEFSDHSSKDLTDIEVLIVLLEDRRFFQHRGSRLAISIAGAFLEEYASRYGDMVEQAPLICSLFARGLGI